MTGFVYFLRCGEFVKIGFSESPRRRHKSFRTGCPYEFELLASFEGSRVHEKHVHRMLRLQHHAGEWFRDGTEVRSIVAAGLPSISIDERPPSPLNGAIELAGSEAKLGEAIGFSQVAVNKAKHGRVSPEMAMAIHRWSGALISVHALRPDLPWPEQAVA